MDIQFDGFEDFHLRMGPSSSILQELGCLTPPSPILRSSDLPESFTSADIPIILFESPLGDEDPFGTPLIPLEPFISLSESATTLASLAGTFGPRRVHAHRPPPINSRLSVNCDTVSSWSYPSPISPIETIASEREADMLSSMSEASFHTALSAPNSQSSLSSNDSSSMLPQERAPSTMLLNRHPSQLFSPTPSPLSFTFPASTFGSSNIPPSHSGISNISCSTARSRSPSPAYDQRSIYELNSPTCSTMSALSSYSSQLSLSTNSLRQPRQRSNPNLRLPPTLAWLQDMNIGLLIDQEGFRSIHPSFKFVGYSDNARALDHQGEAIDGGVAQFMPTRRQSFHFHYAMFDGLPILRRLTVNNNESRDHICRQATLSLKSNGVYTIRGCELLEYKAGGTSEGQKLRWKFDYLVDDRKARATGSIIDGEKTLTPLTFSCSPMLLHPKQGKRIRLMHIMKKSVVSKLIAEKVEPPRSRSALEPSSNSNVPSSGKLASGFHPQKSHPALSRVWNMHRRTQSQAQSIPSKQHSRQSSRSSIQSEFSAAAGLENYDVSRTVRRRRRASSAGEGAAPAIVGSPSFGVAVTNMLATFVGLGEEGRTYSK